MIKNLSLHSVTGKNDNSFVGLKLNNGRIDFYYPETYDIAAIDDEKELRNDILSIIRTISLAKTNSSDLNRKTYGKAENHQFPVVSFLWIIKDYLSNGFYKNREKIYKLNKKGRINWKRTLLSQPIISNGNVIYNNLIVETKDDLDNIMVQIHKQSIKISIDYIGWLFNINSKFLGKLPFNEKIRKVYVQAILKELDSTYDDMKKIRLRNILNVIKNTDYVDEEKEFTYGVDSYDYVYERLLDMLFGTENVKDYNPKSSWFLKKFDYVEKKATSLRPDTIMIYNKNIYVLDAKNYRYGFTGEVTDLPSITSIQKQVTYGEYIYKKINLDYNDKFDNIYNAFILPFNSRNTILKESELIPINNHLSYIGYSKTEYKNNDKNYEIVYAFLIDMKYLVKNYNKRDNFSDIEELVNGILENKISLYKDGE